MWYYYTHFTEGKWKRSDHMKVTLYVSEPESGPRNFWNLMPPNIVLPRRKIFCVKHKHTEQPWARLRWVCKWNTLELKEQVRLVLNLGLPSHLQRQNGFQTVNSWATKGISNLKRDLTRGSGIVAQQVKPPPETPASHTGASLRPGCPTSYPALC